MAIPRALLWALVFALPAATGSTTQAANLRPSVGPTYVARDLLADRLWDDGQAEFSIYKGTIERYGKSRALAAKIIVVKEDMDVAQRVKSETGPVANRTRAVLKLNYLRDFNTGTYDYHQMSSTFLNRRTGMLEKLAMSSTEGCGITYVQVLPHSKAWRHVSHSYWDGEADHARTLAPRAGRTVVAADALPLWLRRLDLTKAQWFEVDLLPSQVSGRANETKFLPAGIEVVGRAERHGLPVNVLLGGRPDQRRTDRYWFDPAWPHALTRFEGGADPTVLTRVKTMRLAYWLKTSPGDERLIGR